MTQHFLGLFWLGNAIAWPSNMFLSVLASLSIQFGILCVAKLLYLLNLPGLCCFYNQ